MNNFCEMCGDDNAILYAVDGPTIACRTLCGPCKKEASRSKVMGADPSNKQGHPHGHDTPQPASVSDEEGDTEFSFRDEFVTDEMLLDRYKDHRPEMKRLREALEKIGEVYVPWPGEKTCERWDHWVRVAQQMTKIARKALDGTQEGNSE